MKSTLTMAAAAVFAASALIAPLAFAENAKSPAPASPDAATGGAGNYLSEQLPNQISANDYIGNAVYTATDDNIGTVTDLIMEEKGGIVAAVVGVGGFLGIGAKDVAVPMDKITVTRDMADGTVRLTTVETAETLKTAPEYVTLKDKSAALRATMPPAMPPAQDNAPTSSTTP